MLRQASIRQLRTGKVSRRNGYIVISMCFYPRGIRKELRDEYCSDLAPDRELFKNFKKFQQLHGHEQGFKKSHYEKRFKLSPIGLQNLERLAKRSATEDVYFVCQCEAGERCHREILLLLAKKRFAAKIDRVFNRYRATILEH